MLTNRSNWIAPLAIGVGIGAVAIVILALLTMTLTFREFQTAQRVVVFATNLAFVLWAILYAPIKVHSLNRRIAALETVIEKNSISASGPSAK